MKRLVRSSDWPTHVAAVALVLLLVAPVIDDGAAPAIIAAGAVLAMSSAYGFWCVTHREPHAKH